MASAFIRDWRSQWGNIYFTNYSILVVLVAMVIGESAIRGSCTIDIDRV